VLAFAFKIDLANAQADETKWPMSRTSAFVVLTGAALWALIVGLVYIAI
jgi:hypothetical protein